MAQPDAAHGPTLWRRLPLLIVVVVAPVGALTLRDISPSRRWPQPRGAAGISRRELCGHRRSDSSPPTWRSWASPARGDGGHADGRIPVRGFRALCSTSSRRHGGARDLPCGAVGPGRHAGGAHGCVGRAGRADQGRHRREPVGDAVPDPAGAGGAVLRRQRGTGAGRACRCTASSCPPFSGIIPGAVVYTSVGAGLGAVFARGETPDLGIIFEPQILLPILGLCALAAAADPAQGRPRQEGVSDVDRIEAEPTS